jgi:NADH:ubiquinone oxidoreductase subunit 6 (subunit J)
MDIGMAIAFWALAAVTVGSALAVILVRNVFRAALFLVLCFFAIAGDYVLLSADFLAAAQVLIYVGAIAVLIIFAIMMSREVRRGNPSGRFRFVALLVAALFLTVAILAVLGTDWTIITEIPSEPTTPSLAQAIFGTDGGFILPFEIAAALLLAAVIGAIVLVRER